MSGYRIMSFDGGPAALTVLPALIDIEWRNKGFLAATSLFVGASSGAWTALYLARNMGLVDSGAITGEQLLEACLAFLQSALHAMNPLDPCQAWVDFLCGKGPLLSYDGVQQVMIEPANYGRDTLGGVTARRVVIVAGRADAPWSPRVYDSGEPADATSPLYDVALCSGSFPMIYPIREGQVDGAMYTNNPAMVGLVQALAGTSRIPAVPLAQTILLTLGSDDGSSNLSNLFLPGAHAESTPPPAPAGEVARSPDLAEVDRKVRALVDRLPAAEARIKAIVDALTRGDEPLIEERTAAGMRGFIGHLRSRTLETQAEIQSPTPGARRVVTTVAPPPAEQLWGWPQWTVFPLNFLYLLQVMLNSQGRGVGDQCTRLLGTRALRLGPVTVLPTNEAATMLLLGLDDLVGDFGELTAALWRLSEGEAFEAWLGFKPSFKTARTWVREAWMPGATPARGRGIRDVR